MKAVAADCLKKLNLDFDLTNAKPEDMEAAMQDPKFKVNYLHLEKVLVLNSLIFSSVFPDVCTKDLASLKTELF